MNYPAQVHPASCGTDPTTKTSESKTTVAGATPNSCSKHMNSLVEIEEQATPNLGPNRLRASVDPSLPSSPPITTTIKFQCVRCLHSIELPSNHVGSTIRCGKCHRRLRLPKSFRCKCPHCGRISSYDRKQSGQSTPCLQCGKRISIPIQTLSSKRRRRKHHLRVSSSILPLFFSVIMLIVGILMCFRLLSSY